MDLITYVSNSAAMYTEGVLISAMKESPLKELFTIADDALTFNVTKIPVSYSNDGKSVCLCRGVSRELIEQSTSIQVLGECIDNKYVFDSIEAQNLYESVYDTNTRMIDDGEGGQISYTPPYMIGVFA